MKAAIHLEYGTEEAISFINKKIPEPKEDEVLVRVHNTTVNRTDCGYLTATPAIMRLFAGLRHPRNPMTGSDFAGTVVETGKNVFRFKSGDRVAGFDDGMASHAEYLVIEASRGITKIPDSLSFVKAAASFEGAHYAYNFIKRIEGLNGKKVLLNGATGAIGSAGLQFLKYHEAVVTAVCHSDYDKLVKSLGADRIIHYDADDFTKGEEVYDVVFDAVGKSTFGKCKPILTENGLYVSSELGPKAQNPFLSLISPIIPGKRIKFPIPTNIKQSLEYILDRLEDNSFEPVIDRTYPFDNIKEAFGYVLTGEKIGNVVLGYVG